MSNKDSNSNPNTFTARDFLLLAGVMNCMKNELAVDYNKFARRFNFENANSAKASWHSLKRKLDKMDYGGTVEHSLTITPAEDFPKRGGWKRKAINEDADADSDDQAKGKKAQHRFPTPQVGKAAAMSDHDDDEEMVFGGYGKTKRGRYDDDDEDEGFRGYGKVKRERDEDEDVSASDYGKIKRDRDDDKDMGSGGYRKVKRDPSDDEGLAVVGSKKIKYPAWKDMCAGR